MANKEAKPEEPEEGAAEASEEEGAGPPSAKRKIIKVGGAVVALVGVGAMAAMMAVPGEEVIPVFQGPFVAPMFATEGEDIQVNLAGNGAKRYLAMELVFEYDVYDPAYFDGRVADEHFSRTAKDAMIGLAGSKTLEYLMDPATQRVFLEEVRDLAEPLLFPVHVGDGAKPTDPDSASGLRPGLSMYESTFRASFFEHHVAVDPVEKTLQLDNGPLIPFDGTEEDLAVSTTDGLVVYVDVTRLDPEFEGEIDVGVHGRLRRVLKEKFLVQ